MGTGPRDVSEDDGAGDADKDYAPPRETKGVGDSAERAALAEDLAEELARVDASRASQDAIAAKSLEAFAKKRLGGSVPTETAEAQDLSPGRKYLIP